MRVAEQLVQAQKERARSKELQLPELAAVTALARFATTGNAGVQQQTSSRACLAVHACPIKA